MLGFDNKVHVVRERKLEVLHFLFVSQEEVMRRTDEIKLQLLEGQIHVSGW